MTAYEQPRRFESVLAGQRIVYFSKPGLPDWDDLSPAVRLLAQVAEMQPGWRALLLGSGHSALGAYLAQQVPQGMIVLADPNIIARRMATLTVRANGLANAALLEGLALAADQEGSFDAVFILLPKGRKLAQRWLLEAHAALRRGGALYLAGANEAGIQPAARDAQALFGEGAVLGYKKGSRVVRLVKSAQARELPGWASAPGIARGTWYEFELVLAGQSVRVRSLPGVFSYDRLDEGTSLLLEQLEVARGGVVLDLGCGWGALGIAACLLGAAWVDLVDADLLAVASAGENLASLRLPNARAFPGDVASEVLDRRYNLVATNPPFHSGRAVDYDIVQAIIDQSRQVLAPGGRLLLVANRFLRYEPLLRDNFPRVERAAETGKYLLWSAYG